MRIVAVLGVRGLAAGLGTTVMLVLAVALGTAFQIPNTANLDGLHAALLEDGLAYGAGDIRIEARDRARFVEGTTQTLPALRELIARRELPVHALVTSLVFPGAVRAVPTPGVTAPAKFFGAPVIGLDPGAVRPFHVVAGTDLPAESSLRSVLVGATIANRLQLRIGDAVQLRVLYGGSTALGDSNQGSFEVVVRGIVTSSNGAYRFVFVDRALLGDAAGTPTGLTTIGIHLDDHASARALVPVFAAALPDARVVAWRDDEPGFASYLDARDVIGAVSYAMVIAAIAIPMWALLYIQVLRRRRELAILRSLGFTRLEIAAICVVQALAIAVTGCAIGAGLGYAAIQYFAANPLFEWESLRVTPIASPSTFLVPCLVIVVTAILAAVPPAWRASRVAPASVLRRIE